MDEIDIVLVFQASGMSTLPVTQSKRPNAALPFYDRPTLGCVPLSRPCSPAPAFRQLSVAPRSVLSRPAAMLLLDPCAFCLPLSCPQNIRQFYFALLKHWVKNKYRFLHDSSFMFVTC